MNSLSTVLRDDHQACDRLFAEAERATSGNDFATARSEFARFREATERHFDVEESMLFPVFEESTGETRGPTEMMRHEHRTLRGLLDKMEQALAQGQSAEYVGLGETLLVMLQQHNFKEENVLYPMIEQILGSQQDKMLARLRDAGIG